MKQHLKLLLFVSTISLAAVGCSSSSKKAEAKLPTTLEQAVDSSYRTPANKTRDQFRHPAETLSFFGVKPDMTVVEISPGGGWYLEILAPYLASNGKYIAAIFPENTDSKYMATLNAKLIDWLKQHPEVESNVTLTPFAAPDHLKLAEDSSVDMVLTFRNVHSWIGKGTEKEVFASFFKALKPGGVLGVVQHRANPKVKRDPKAKSGYVLERDLIKLAESTGFKLDAKSEVNANAKDTSDHPEGVWTLPPSLRLKDKDREKYTAIGESDRMTLRFVKP